MGWLHGLSLAARFRTCDGSGGGDDRRVMTLYCCSSECRIGIRRVVTGPDKVFLPQDRSCSGVVISFYIVLAYWCDIFSAFTTLLFYFIRERLISFLNSLRGNATVLVVLQYQIVIFICLTHLEKKCSKHFIGSQKFPIFHVDSFQ